MTPKRRARMEAAGWRLGDAAELLELTEVEAALVEAKVALGDAVRALRRRGRLSQQALATRMGSSQSRVAKLEGHHPEISIDLQLRAVFAAHPGARRDFHRLVARWTAVARRAPPHQAR